MNPRSKKLIPSSPDEWMSHAESEVKLARLAVGDPNIRGEQVGFHAQQAAEKAIKAVLLSRGVEFPLTHDLEELIEIPLPADGFVIGEPVSIPTINSRLNQIWKEINVDVVSNWSAASLYIP